MEEPVIIESLLNAQLCLTIIHHVGVWWYPHSIGEETEAQGIKFSPRTVTDRAGFYLNLDLSDIRGLCKFTILAMRFWFD